MSQISKSKDFQRGLWVLEVTYHFKASGRAVNRHDRFYDLVFRNFYVLLAAILKRLRI